jgi:hypothetical protein
MFIAQIEAGLTKILFRELFALFNLRIQCIRFIDTCRPSSVLPERAPE